MILIDTADVEKVLWNAVFGDTVGEPESVGEPIAETPLRLGREAVEVCQDLVWVCVECSGKRWMTVQGRKHSRRQRQPDRFPYQLRSHLDDRYRFRRD